MIVISNDNRRREPITNICAIRAAREVLALLRASKREAYRADVARLCSAARHCLERLEEGEGLTRRARDFLRE